MKAGQKMKALRIERDLTLDQLAEMSGVAKATLSRIENGVNSGNIKTLKKVAASLHVSLDDLITQDQDAVVALPPEDTVKIESIKRDLKEIAMKLHKVCKALGITIEG